MEDNYNNFKIASFAIVVGLRMSRKPADRDHAYGHLRAETIASLIAFFNNDCSWG